MTHDTERISRYLDGELGHDEVRELERHLADCADCRTALGDLRLIVAAAPGYQGRTPSNELWAGIATQLERPPLGVVSGSILPARRRFTVPQLAAAAIGALAIGAGAVWFALQGGTQPVPVAVGPGAAVMTAAASPADLAYNRAVADLEQILAAGRDQLNPETMAAIERSLAVIDQAIAEARAAVLTDPGAADLQEWVTANMRRKLDVLRGAAAAVTLPAAL